MSSNLPDVSKTCHEQAGRLRHCIDNWQKITSDKTILSDVYGVNLQFKNGQVPCQPRVPPQIRFNEKEQIIIDTEIKNFLERGIIEKAFHCEGEYISNIFIRPKKNGTYRVILNLKPLNEQIEYYHFKMDTFETALKMVTPNCWMQTIDLRDAYYCVPVAEESRIWLRF